MTTTGDEKLTAERVLAFVSQQSGRAWQTSAHGISFRARVVGAGLKITLPTGLERNVSTPSVRRFFAWRRETGEGRKHLKKGFNNSYLGAIVLALEEEFEASEVPALAEELPEGVVYREGAALRIQVNAYERSAAARRACLAAHGTRCAACGSDLADIYGPTARGLIHVHHLRPLATQQGEDEVDPVRDLRPVCPNCHCVIHANNSCRSINEIQAMIAATRAQQLPLSD